MPENFKTIICNGVSDILEMKKTENLSFVNDTFRKLLIKAYIALLAFYDMFISKNEDMFMFDHVGFLMSREKKYFCFLKELTETQMFNYFTQFNAEKAFPFFYEAYRSGLEDKMFNLNAVELKIGLFQKQKAEEKRLIFEIEKEWPKIHFDCEDRVTVIEPDEGIVIDESMDRVEIYSFVEEKTKSGKEIIKGTVTEEDEFEKRDRRIMSKINNNRQRRANSMFLSN